MKLVSVVVLAYRSADTIIETLESIKKQTYPKIELIVTDDCSPDNTVEVVENWMRDNKGCLSDMKLVTTEKNTGLPSNINRGLRAATGMYYKGIAGDDYLTEDAIEKYVDFCEKNPGVFPIAKVHLFTEHDNNPSFPKYRHTVINVMILLRKHIKNSIRCCLCRIESWHPQQLFTPWIF